jgi:hypothetical protein
MEPSERGRLLACMQEMEQLRNANNKDVNGCRQNHLSRYATTIKKLALEAISLCKKYGVYDDIEKFDYDASKKAITLNGHDIYHLG